MTITAVAGVPIMRRGDDVGALLCDALSGAKVQLQDDDVLAVTSKLISRAEGRSVVLADVEPGPRARELADVVGRPAALVELVLRESTHVSRAVPGVLIVRHRLGHVSANAGVDFSNVGDGPADAVALLLPEDPDASAARIRAAVERAFGVRVGVVVTDSFGRPFRVGTVGVAIGVAGLRALADYRGARDIYGRELLVTVAALADQIAAAADMVAGQGSEQRGVVLVRGVVAPGEDTSAALLRQPEQDIYL